MKRIKRNTYRKSEVVAGVVLATPFFLLFFLFLNDKLSNLNRIGSGPLANLISTAPEA